MSHRTHDAKAPHGGEPLIDGRYRLLRKLGEGAMGRVYEALDVFLDRRVALKLLPPLDGKRTLAKAAEEARALAAIRHSEVPIVHAFGVHEQRPFFVMELIEGTNLRVILAVHKAHGEVIPLHRSLQIAASMAAALGAAHAARVLHRDVKPQNVIIEADTSRAVLVDFGMALRSLTQRATTAGTPAFMAPEVLAGGPASIASDLYALGGLVYEMLTGSLPFPADTIEELRDALRSRSLTPCSAHRPELQPFDHVLARALAKSPEKRYATCAAFRAALEHVAGVERSEEPDPPEVIQILPRDEDAIRILVADDDPVFARLASRAARIAFADVHVAVSRAPTGPAAVSNAARRIPQLLLLDYNMPGCDGVDVLSRIRALPNGQRVCVVVMSGDVSGELRWRFSALGVKHYLVKPVSFSGLVDVILGRARERGWLPHDVTIAEEAE